VQHLTRGVFLIRQRMSQEGDPSPDNPIIRAFDFLDDADAYVNTLNATQRELDQRFGYWAQDAVEQR
jgi:hypothetical protein